MAMPDPVETPTVSVREAGALLGLSERSAYRAVERGEIPSLRVGRRLMVPTARLRQLLGLDNNTAA
jgi:excisionase family DNA binding protein